MKVLGIGGSPRQDGNTDILLKEMLRGAAEAGTETEEIYLRDLKYIPCRSCHKCSITGCCELQDDMQPLYAKFVKADCIALSSPIHFYGVSTHTKMMIDRCQCAWAKKYILKQSGTNNKRKGIFISAGGTKGKNLFEGAVLTVKYFFDAICFAYSKELLVRSIDTKGEINNHPDIMKEAYELGKIIL